MNRRELVIFLNKLEQQYPVADWKYKGVDVWPVLKTKLFFLYLHKYLEPELGVPKVKLPIQKTLVRFLKSVWLNIRTLVAPPDTSGIFFSDAKSYYSKLGPLSVNRFYYPIQQFLKREKSYHIFQTSINEEYEYPEDYKHQGEILFIGSLAYCRQIILRLSKKLINKKRNIVFKDKLAVYQEIGEAMPSFFISNNQIDNLIDQLVSEILLFKKMYLRLLSPSTKMVYQLCYYTPQHYGLNLACKDLSITSCEIMHGGMGDMHIAYSGWESSIPKSGYNVMPQKLWLWDQPSYDLTRKWAEKTDYHNCFVGGFPWLNYILESYISPFPNTNKKIIVYTMQFEFIEEYIYEAIEKTDESFEWWLRFHPRKAYARKDIEAQLSTRNIRSRVNLDDANSIPLPIILKECWLHLSEFSGSIIEASLLNKKTIILSPIGAAAYYQYIQDGSCIFLESKNSGLLSRIINTHSAADISGNRLSFRYEDIFTF